MGAALNTVLLAALKYRKLSVCSFKALLVCGRLMELKKKGLERVCVLSAQWPKDLPWRGKTWD